jgi:hypothetical protein
MAGHRTTRALARVRSPKPGRQVLEPGMCGMISLFVELLPNDKDFQKTMRAFKLRNDFWAEEPVVKTTDRVVADP